MRGQGSLSARSAPQAPQQPQQHDPMFNKGRAFFARLQADAAQEYRNFKKLDEVEMASQIDALSLWRIRGGPQN